MSRATPELSMPAITGALRCVWEAQATLGEGTCWSVRHQALWWVDILEHRLHRYRPADGACSSWQFDEEISAIAERGAAPGLVATLRHRFVGIDEDAPNRSPRPLQRPGEEPPGNRFNDGKCDGQGRFWGGTMDFACRAHSGALYRFDPDGRYIRHQFGFAVTNGPTWSRDGRTMYFNDTVAGTVHALDFEPATGALSNRREWLRFASGDGLPDGMTTDAAGRIWIAHWGGACVSCHEPLGARELGRIVLPTRHVTNCAFGGPELRTLYITSARAELTPQQLAGEPLAGGLFAVGLAEGGVPAGTFGA